MTWLVWDHWFSTMFLGTDHFDANVLILIQAPSSATLVRQKWRINSTWQSQNEIPAYKVTLESCVWRGIKLDLLRFMVPLHYLALVEVEAAARDALLLFTITDSESRRLERNVKAINHNFRCLECKVHCALYVVPSLTLPFGHIFFEVYRNKLPRISIYIDFDALIMPLICEGVRDQDMDWVLRTVLRANIAFFTNAVWSDDDDRYDEAISNFQIIMPLDILFRQDIIDMFLEMVARWAVVDSRSTINQCTTKDLVNKMRARIEMAMKDGLFVRVMVLQAFEKKYGCVRIWKRSKSNALFF